jgi:hypothetical protein
MQGVRALSYRYEWQSVGRVGSKGAQKGGKGRAVGGQGRAGGGAARGAEAPHPHPRALPLENKSSPPAYRP